MKVRITIEMEPEVFGDAPVDWIKESVVHAMHNSMPALIVDDEELDCQVWTREWTADVEEVQHG